MRIPTLLLGTLYEDNRRHPLRIAGPPGIESWVRTLATSMGYGVENRNLPFEVTYQELLVGVDTSVGPVEVRSFETHHQPHTHPHGFIVETGTHRIAYSGDTGWFD